MTESITSRVARVLGGAVHALIDTLESGAPESTMAQALRELERAVDDVRTELGQAEAIRHLAGSSLERLRDQNRELERQIALAVGGGDEPLARVGIARQIDIEDQIAALERAQRNAVERSRELEAYIIGLTARRREMEDAAREYAKARNAAAAPRSALALTGATGRERGERAVEVFDRLLSRQASFASVPSPIGAGATQLQALQDLARNSSYRGTTGQPQGSVRRSRLGPKVSTILAPELWPFSLALLMLTGISALEIAALLFGTSVGHWLDWGIGEIGASDGLLDGALGWLHLGRVPALLVLVAFLASFAVTGFAIEILAVALVGRFLPMPLAVGSAGIASLLMVRAAGGALTCLVPREESSAVSDVSLVGRAGVIVIGTAEAGRPAEARVRDQFGAAHYVMAEPDDAATTLGTGVRILLVGHMSGRRYRAIENPKPEVL